MASSTQQDAPAGDQTSPVFETEVGITQFTTPNNFGLSGIHKQRYSDFIVREIFDGKICHLETTSLEVEKELFPNKADTDHGRGHGASAALDIPALVKGIEAAYSSSGGSDSFTMSSEVIQSIQEYLENCITKNEDCPVKFSTTLVATDKSIRKALHEAFRTHAGGLVETLTEIVNDESGAESIQQIGLEALHKRAINPAKRASHHQAWPKTLPNFLQFTLLKENCDTINATSYMAKTLKLKNGASAFGYAGTKDKRAVTAQKMTVYRKRPSEIARVNGTNNPFTLRVGDFTYVDAPIKLGENNGNHFEITLRNVNRTTEEILESCNATKNAGFINYFGLQRFGKGKRKSHELGKAIFQSNYKLFCNPTNKTPLKSCIM